MKAIFVAAGFGVLLAACSSPRSREPKTTDPKTVEAKSVETEAAKTKPTDAIPPPSPAPKEAPPAPSTLREVFPHVRADITARLVEFDGTVPIDTHNPETPVVYLEVTVCTPDTKEHESLVVTPAKPSHIHAALLAAGFQSGSPGSWKWQEQKLSSIPPTGDGLEVSIAYRGPDGAEIEAPAVSWICNAAQTGPKFGATHGSRFVFAGSAMVKRQGREVYNADGSGLLIGLTTFGSESIAWSEVISHEAEITSPEWIADARMVPKYGTPVVVRLRPTR